MICQHFVPPALPSWSDLPDLELYMDQVISVLGRYLQPLSGEESAVTSTMINNYVKQKYLAAPIRKRYQRSHLATLLILCVCKQFMQLSEIDLLLQNLRKSRDDQALYRFFSEELNAALRGETPEKEPLSSETDEAVRAAATAFAAIARARFSYERAKALWPDPEEEARRADEARKEEEKRREEEKKREKSKKEEKKKEKKS